MTSNEMANLAVMISAVALLIASVSLVGLMVRMWLWRKDRGRK